MKQRIVRIADLPNYSNSKLKNVTIKVSVSIRSLRHGNNRHGYFYMDLRDDSGDIPAVAYTNNEPCDNQLHLIQDNRTYTFTNIALTNSKYGYSIHLIKKEIVLNNYTVVKLCGIAPKVEWLLTPLNKVCRLETQVFFNIVGLCANVTETEVVCGEPMRRVTLVDETRNEVTLNVWNQETWLFDELDLNCHPVVFVKDATYRSCSLCWGNRRHCSNCRGDTYVTTSRYLQLLRPDDPRAAEIRSPIQRRPLRKVFKMPSLELLDPDLRMAMTALSQADGLIGRAVVPRRTHAYCTPSNITRKNNQKYATIADLASVTEPYTVSLIATVTIKSIRFTDEDIYFYMDLRDDTSEIVAVAYNDACVKFQNYIETNNTYSFTGFTLRKSDGLNTSIPHRRMLVLEHDSGVRLCGSAPKVEWPLSPLNVVHAENGMEFYHVFGLYIRIKGRMVTLVDQLGREVFLEVRDEYAAMLEALEPRSRPVVFVKDARMAGDKCEGNMILVAGKYVELLDPDDPRARGIPEVLGVPARSSYEYFCSVTNVVFMTFTSVIVTFIIVYGYIQWLEGKHISLIQYVIDLYTR